MYKVYPADGVETQALSKFVEGYSFIHSQNPSESVSRVKKFIEAGNYCFTAFPRDFTQGDLVLLIKIAEYACPILQEEIPCIEKLYKSASSFDRDFLALLFQKEREGNDVVGSLRRVTSFLQDETSIFPTNFNQLDFMIFAKVTGIL